MATKMLTITHNGFHGRRTITIRPLHRTGEPATFHGMHGMAEVSARTARRLNNAVCGMLACVCGEQMAYEYDYDGHWWVQLPWDGREIRGNYPQATKWQQTAGTSWSTVIRSRRRSSIIWS